MGQTPAFKVTEQSQSPFKDYELSEQIIITEAEENAGYDLKSSQPEEFYLPENINVG